MGHEGIAVRPSVEARQISPVSLVVMDLLGPKLSLRKELYKQISTALEITNGLNEFDIMRRA